MVTLPNESPVDSLYFPIICRELHVIPIAYCIYTVWGRLLLSWRHYSWAGFVLLGNESEDLQPANKTYPWNLTGWVIFSLTAFIRKRVLCFGTTVSRTCKLGSFKASLEGGGIINAEPQSNMTQLEEKPLFWHDTNEHCSSKYSPRCRRANHPSKSLLLCRTYGIWFKAYAPLVCALFPPSGFHSLLITLLVPG